MCRRTATRWRIHPISLTLSVFPLFGSLPASHLLQTVRTPVGAAGWESRLGCDRLRINASFFSPSSNIKVGFFAFCWQTGDCVCCKWRIKKHKCVFLLLRGWWWARSKRHLGGDVRELKWCPPGSFFTLFTLFWFFIVGVLSSLHCYSILKSNLQWTLECRSSNLELTLSSYFLPISLNCVKMFYFLKTTTIPT